MDNTRTAVGRVDDDGGAKTAIRAVDDYDRMEAAVAAAVEEALEVSISVLEEAEGSKEFILHAQVKSKHSRGAEELQIYRYKYLKVPVLQ
ncbi:hypothetical protein COOONC_16254 [Cooperia oncophora]